MCCALSSKQVLNLAFMFNLTKLCTHTHVHTHICTHTFAHTHTHTHICTHTCVHTHTCTHTHTHTHICAHTHVHPHTCTCTHTRAHTHACACTHTCACTHAHTHAHAYTHKCTHAHTHARKPARVRAHTQFCDGYFINCNLLYLFPVAFCLSSLFVSLTIDRHTVCLSSNLLRRLSWYRWTDSE